MPHVALTDLAVRGFPAPAKGTETYWDANLKGFGVRVGSGGAETFIVLIGPGRRQKIGRYPIVGLSEARQEARRVLAEKQLGKVRPTHTAWEDAVAEFLRECETRNKPRTVSDYRRLLSRHFPFKRASVADIGPREIVRRLSALNATPAEKHHAFTAIRRFYSWCLANHIVEENPTARMRVPPPGKSRDRVLSDDELRAVWNAARTLRTPFHGIVALLCLTGARRSEVAALRWEWITEDRIEWPAEAVKNGRRHAIPVGDEVLAVLASLPRQSGSPYVFPALRQSRETTTTFNGWGKPKARFDEECGAAGWTLHDLRRTYASGMQRLGVRLEVTEALLNHRSGSSAGIVGVYQRYSWMPEMREAVLHWEGYLASLIAPTA